MMIIDQQTLVMGGILLASAVGTPLCSPFFWHRKDDDAEEAATAHTPIRFSVVLSVHDQACLVRENLPAFLTQHYDSSCYEVIVVDESTGNETKEALDELKARYPNLYTTFIPPSSHYLSRRKLALTLGVKAAKNDWIVFTDIDCQPESDEWLNALAARCTADADVVCGYTGYDDDAPAFYKFERLHTWCRLLRHPYRNNGCNMAFRRQLFLEKNGFLANLKYLRGEYDFIVNECPDPDRVVFASEERIRLRQKSPTSKEWNAEHLNYAETRRHLTRTFTPRFLFMADQTALHLNYLLQTAAICLASLTDNWLLLGIASFCLLLTLVARLLIVRRTASALGEDFATIRIPTMELRLVWQKALWLLRHKYADKYEFIRR